MDGISLWFEFDNDTWYINSSKLKNKNQFLNIVEDLIESGKYTSWIRRKYNLDYDQVVSNLFREGGALIFLVKVITEKRHIPHNNFWNNQIGRNVASNLYFQRWNNQQENPYLTDLMRLHEVNSSPQKPNKDKLSKSTKRKKLFEEWNGICIGCKQRVHSRFMELDHIKPRSKGGSDHIENLQLLCSDCNRKKRDKDNDVFMKEMEDERKSKIFKNKIDLLLEKLKEDYSG